MNAALPTPRARGVRAGGSGVSQRRRPVCSAHQASNAGSICSTAGFWSPPSGTCATRSNHASSSGSRLAAAVSDWLAITPSMPLAKRARAQRRGSRCSQTPTGCAPPAFGDFARLRRFASVPPAPSFASASVWFTRRVEPQRELRCLPKTVRSRRVNPFYACEGQDSLGTRGLVLAGFAQDRPAPEIPIARGALPYRDSREVREDNQMPHGRLSGS